MSARNRLRQGSSSRGFSNSHPQKAAPVPPPSNAWARPLHQAAPRRPPPGMTPPTKSTAATNVDSYPSSNGGSVQNDLRDRFIHFSLSLVGRRVTVTKTDGTVFEGVFHTFTPFSSSEPSRLRNTYIIKGCKMIRGQDKSTDKSNGTTSGTQITDGCTVVVPTGRVSNLQVKNMNFSASGSGSDGSKGGVTDKPRRENGETAFRTDREISGSKGDRKRGLVAAGHSWVSGGLESKGTENRTRPPNSLEGSIGNWDQFQANEELFDVRASFDETIYTTELKESEFNAEVEKKAERLAREIETTVSPNIHVTEERNQKMESDFDQEDLYSGVIRENVPSSLSGNKQKQDLPTTNDENGQKTTSAVPTPAEPAEPEVPDSSPTDTQNTENDQESADDTKKNNKQAVPEEDTSNKLEDKKTQEDESKITPTENDDAAGNSSVSNETESTETDADDTKKKDAKTDSKVKSKYTLNPKAAAFTPRVSMGSSVQPDSVPPVAQAGYNASQMTPVFPMTNAHFTDPLRYSGNQFMVDHMAQMPQHPGPVQAQQPQDTSASGPTPEVAPTESMQQNQQQAGMHMYPAGPQSGFYAIHQGAQNAQIRPFPLHMVGRPPQMQVIPNASPYALYGGAIAPMQASGMTNMSMRGPGGGNAAYYGQSAAAAHMPNMYPPATQMYRVGHGSSDDDPGYRGGGRGGGGRMRTNRRSQSFRKTGRGGGGGRGNHQNQTQHGHHQENMGAPHRRDETSAGNTQDSGFDNQAVE